MKRLTATLIIFALILGLSGCSSSRREAERSHDKAAGTTSAVGSYTLPQSKGLSPTDSTAGETVMLDNDYVTVTALAAGTEDDGWEYGLNVRVKNKSDNVVCLEVERSAINDAVCWCYWNVTLQPGQETDETINWYMSSLKPQFIDDVDKIYIEFTGYQENFYGSNYFQEEPSVYYPHGEENYSRPERQESELIFDENGCRMYYLGSGWSDSYGGYLMSVCVENDTETTVDFDMDDTAVNGTTVTNYWGEVVPAGCREYTYILWDEDDLKYVDTVEKVKLKVQVWQWDNYNAGYLVDGEYTVIP